MSEAHLSSHKAAAVGRPQQIVDARPAWQHVAIVPFDVFLRRLSDAIAIAPDDLAHSSFVALELQGTDRYMMDLLVLELGVDLHERDLVGADSVADLYRAYVIASLDLPSATNRGRTLGGLLNTARNQETS